MFTSFICFETFNKRADDITKHENFKSIWIDTLVTTEDGSLVNFYIREI